MVLVICDTWNVGMLPAGQLQYHVHRPAVCLTVLAILASQGSIFSLNPFGLFFCVRPSSILRFYIDPFVSSCLCKFFDIACFDRLCTFDSVNPFGLFSLWPCAFSFCFFSAPPQCQTIFWALPEFLIFSVFFSTLWTLKQRPRNKAKPFESNRQNR